MPYKRKRWMRQKMEGFGAGTIPLAIVAPISGGVSRSLRDHRTCRADIRSSYVPQHRQRLRRTRSCKTGYSSPHMCTVCVCIFA